MFDRINDERLLAGKKPIGFLNQILINTQKYSQMYFLLVTTARKLPTQKQITDGSNPGCGTPGFKAAKGWDTVSGMGSPQFPKLRDLLVGLP
jgi:tripeptidyl-peptidase-1